MSGEYMGGNGRFSTPTAGSRPATAPASRTDTSTSGGRADDTIIRGGENIAPAEIEDVMVHHHHVREVAVIGTPDDEWGGERICAVIVPASKDHDDAESIRNWCRERLRGSRTPDDVVFVDELPPGPPRPASSFAGTSSSGSRPTSRRDDRAPPSTSGSREDSFP